MSTILDPPRRAAPAIEPVGSELVSGYQVIAHLNRGARLDVYDAWSIERESRCVLKTLRPDRAGDKRAATALAREGRLLRRFTHPHLGRAYDVTRTADGLRPVVVLETLGGETLSHLLHRLGDEGRQLDPAEVAVLGQQLASALSYLHRHGWLHLDLKPSNIIVVGGSARLIDLSIARHPGRARPGTGTREYLAPEQARGGELTAAADVWGLGAVLFAALAGDSPYGDADSSGGSTFETATEDGREAVTESVRFGNDPIASVHDESDTGAGTVDSRETGTSWLSRTETLDSDVTYPQLMSDPPPIGTRSRVPVSLGRLVDACLRRDPEARPTLPEVAAELRGWLASLDVPGEPR